MTSTVALVRHRVADFDAWKKMYDGFVAGIWRVDDGRVVLEPFEPLSAAARGEVEDEAGRLEAFLAQP